jgi:hypothetical protein
MDTQATWDDKPGPANAPARRHWWSTRPAQPGRANAPARRHWWSTRPAQPARPISARRAYAEVLGVFAAFFAASVLAGAEALAHRYPKPSGSWAVFTPSAISQLGASALAIGVTVLLSAARGVTPQALGLGLPRKQNGKLAAGSAFRTGVWAVAALLAGTAVTASLSAARIPHPARPDASFYLVYGTAASIGAGVIEEVVVLAFVVTTLRQARRPLPEIVAVAVLLRCSYHDYYGPGVLGIVIWATVFVWLFLRLGSVIPLIVVHFLWDASIFYEQNKHWFPAIVGLGFAAVVLLPVAAGITLLIEVLGRPDQRTPS